MSEASWFFGRSAGTAGRRNTYWLVEERGCGGLEVPISVLAAGLRVLPVFGFEEEAGLFLRLAFRGGRWVRRIGTGELVSLLRGPLGGVEFVALDPLSDAEADMLDESMSLSRQGFLDFLHRTGIPDETPSPARTPVPYPEAQTKTRTA